MKIQSFLRDPAFNLALRPFSISTQISAIQVLGWWLSIQTSSEWFIDLNPQIPPEYVWVKLKYSHLFENYLLSHDEPCESKVVQKFGKARKRDLKYGISYISSQTISLKTLKNSRKQEVAQIIWTDERWTPADNTTNSLLHPDIYRMLEPDSREIPKGYTF